VTPRTLHDELEARGLIVLAVTQDVRDPHMVTVYLHGNAGQYGDGYARDEIAKVPGVVEATPSPTTPTILLVRVESGDLGSA
jgi:hypothetical protein